MSGEGRKVKQRQLAVMRRALMASRITITCSDGMVELHPMNEVVADQIRDADWSAVGAPQRTLDRTLADVWALVARHRMATRHEERVGELGRTVVIILS